MKKLFNKVKVLGAESALGLMLSLGLTSCASFSGFSNSGDLAGSFSVPASYILFPEPVSAPLERDQILLVNISQLLETKARTHKDRAEVFYELGIIYDRLGLESTARSMFMNALVEKRDFAAPYNFVGIYFAEDGRFQEALDAFDAGNELDPTDVYVNFNRGIVLYYAERYQTALTDLELFYKADKGDPYRLMWLYLAEHEAYGDEEARNNLRQRFKNAPQKAVDDTWGFNIVRLTLGDISEDEFFAGIRNCASDSEAYADHLCEGYFYIGKLKEMAGYDKLAYDYFKLAVATHHYAFLEYRYALREIKILEKKYGMRESIYPKDIQDL